ALSRQTSASVRCFLSARGARTPLAGPRRAPHACGVAADPSEQAHADPSEQAHTMSRSDETRGRSGQCPGSPPPYGMTTEPVDT
ncbi:MAG TPA: hypothetical protein VN764_20355, partial [Polyangiaceae bacterium]|nr:hypothetical protein [Polyangiaceae bacterium]